MESAHEDEQRIGGKVGKLEIDAAPRHRASRGWTRKPREIMETSTASSHDVVGKKDHSTVTASKKVPVGPGSHEASPKGSNINKHENINNFKRNISTYNNNNNNDNNINHKNNTGSNNSSNNKMNSNNMNNSNSKNSNSSNNNINSNSSNNNNNNNNNHNKNNSNKNNNNNNNNNNYNNYDNNNYNKNNNGPRNNNQNKYPSGAQMHFQKSSNSSEISADLELLWHQLTRSISKVVPDKLPLNPNNGEQCRQWRELWSAAGTGASGYAYVLPIVMLVLPDVRHLMPAVEDVVNVLHIVVVRLREPSKGDKKPDILRVLESVVDVIKSRLVGSLQSITDPAHIDGVLMRLITAFGKEVALLLGTEDDRVNTLLGRLKEIDDYRASVKKYSLTFNDSRRGDEEVVLPAQGWSSPSVGWLMASSWHKVRPLKSHYKDAQEYAQTLQEIWTLLTFYWGAAAVWPKCQHQQRGGAGGDDKCCSEPMLQLSNGRGSCSTKKGGQPCGNSSAWKCHRHGHHEICAGCLSLRQMQLIGSPGHTASTDIYDATVDREVTRREGSVYQLTGLQSRKPPTIAPNWNTTYRLQPAALVAVVRLGAGSQRLTKDSPLQWAEVIALDQKTEWQSRRDGRIALRLLTRGDCPTLSTNAEATLERGTKVAIIDIRVFVPEVISVLATLAGNNFVDHFSQIPFKDRLLGIPVPVNGYAYSGDLSVVENILNAINHSEIEFVRRLNAQERERLSVEIYSVPQVQTLYGTQLEGFTAALASAAHFIQVRIVV